MPQWIGDGAEWRRELAASVVVGLFLGLIGPFGSYLNGGLALRLAYWTASCVFANGLYGLGLRWALSQTRRLGQPDWFVLPIACAVLALPMSLAVAASATFLWPRVRLYVHPFDWYAQALVLSLPISAAWLWLNRRAPAGGAPPPAAGPASPVERLTDARVLCLQMEDHYVRIHTPSGSQLVLSPLGAAIEALGATEGLQVHRSWWVARAAVERPVWVGRRLELELQGGLRAPVSRTSVAKLRAAGWLA